jgi:hypothetical protein
MDDLAATLLEASGPLAVLGAQVVYVVQPTLSGLFPTGHLQALAEVLEDNDQAQAFANYLRES